MSDSALVSGFFSSVCDVPISGGVPVSNFFFSIGSALVSNGAPVFSFSSFVGGAPVLNGAPVSSFSSSVSDMPGSGFSSFVVAVTAFAFPLHDSSKFSTLNTGLQQANQMLS